MFRAALLMGSALALAGCGGGGPPKQPQEKSIDDWLQELKNSDASVRSRAALALKEPGKEVPRVVEALGEALDDQDRDVRAAVLFSLGALGPDAADAVPRIVKVLEGDDTPLRRSAASALGKIGDARALPALSAAARDEDVQMRKVARNALAAMGAAGVPFWIELLSSKDEFDRISATSALLRVGPEAKAAVPALSKALKDESVHVRRAAAEVLAPIGAEAQAAVPALVEAASDEDIFVRMNVAWALKEIAPEDEQTAAALRAQLEHPEPWTRVTAAESLWAVGDNPEVLVPVLVDALAQQDVADIPNSNFTAAAMRQRATDVLKKIGDPAVPLLEKLAEEETGEVREVAAKALQALEQAADGGEKLTEEEGGPVEGLKPLQEIPRRERR
jgi:HEAT repeat protein